MNKLDFNEDTDLTEMSFKQYLELIIFPEELKNDKLYIYPEGHLKRHRFSSVKELTKKCIKAIDYLYRAKRALTLSGITEAIGLSDEHVLVHYAEYGKDYEILIKKLKTLCKNFAYDLGMTPMNSKFSIFLLQNYGLSTNAVVTNKEERYTVNINGLKRNDNIIENNNIIDDSCDSDEE